MEKSILPLIFEIKLSKQSYYSSTSHSLQTHWNITPMTFWIVTNSLKLTCAFLLSSLPPTLTYNHTGICLYPNIFLGLYQTQIVVIVFQNVSLKKSFPVF